MALNTVKLDKAVAKFKAAVGPLHELYEYGQFYVTRRSIDDLFKAVESNLNANPRLPKVPDQPRNTIRFFFEKLGKPVEEIDLPGILGMLNAIERGGDMAFIRTLFKPSPSDAPAAQRDFDSLWVGRTDFPGGTPWGPTPTLFKARAAHAIEHDRCWQVLRAFAAMHAKASSVVPLALADQLTSFQVRGAVLREAPGNRQEVRYPIAADLTAAVQKMKLIVDGGRYVHCGVLSGARHEQRKFPSAEHHILVFAWDAVEGQDAFVFWDPDTTRSEIGTIVSSVDGKPWGQGFGLLFSRPGRLCTGIDDADLANIDTNPALKNPTFGDHNSQTKRHCYQAYALQSLPLSPVVKVHTKVLATPRHASLDEMLEKAVWLYAANGIELHEASREVIEPGSDLDRYQILPVGDAASGPSAETTALHSALRDRRSEFGVEPPPDHAVVAIVDKLVPAGRGSALSAVDQPGVVLAAASAGEWTLAHEIGRLAGLEPVDAPGRLMARSTEGVEDPQLTDEETQIFLASPLAQA